MNALKGNAQLRKKNIRLLLSTVKRYGPVSRRELEALTGLSRGTVSVLTNELGKNGYIEISDKQAVEVGRRPETLDINGHDHLIVGVTIKTNVLMAVVTDLKGRMLFRRLKKHNEPTYEYVRETLFAMLDEIMADFRGRVEAISIAVQGVVDVENEVSVRIERIAGWRNVPLKDMTEKRYRVPAFVIHNTTCLLKAEEVIGESGLDRAKNAFFISAGESGIGMAVKINGEAYIGGNGHAGDLGQTRVSSKFHPERAELEEHISPPGLMEDYKEATGADELISLDELLRLGRDGDETALAVLANAGNCLGQALYNAAQLFDPDLLVLNGYICEFPVQFAETVERYVGVRSKENYMELAMSALVEEEATAQGVALLVADKLIAGDMLFLGDDSDM